MDFLVRNTSSYWKLTTTTLVVIVLLQNYLYLYQVLLPPPVLWILHPIFKFYDFLQAVQRKLKFVWHFGRHWD